MCMHMNDSYDCHLLSIYYGVGTYVLYIYYDISFSLSAEKIKTIEVK